MKVKVEKKTNEVKIKELKYGQVFVDLNWIKDEPLMIIRPSTDDDFSCRVDSDHLVLAVSLIDGELYSFDNEYIVYLVDGSFEGTY